VSFSTILAFAIVLLGLGIFLWPGPQFRRRWQHRREYRRRELTEDVLKHIFVRCKEGREASLDSLAGHLGIPEAEVVRMVTRMEAAGLVTAEAGPLALTLEGEARAVQVVRAHRLWETYLANEARLPMKDLHGPAEAAEHRLTARQIDELDASLGHPRTDPHGDPIPRSTADRVTAEAQALAQWPEGVPAEIVHVEDEPGNVFRQIMNTGLRPGDVVQVRQRTHERLLLSDGSREYEFTPLAARNIQVTAAPAPAGDRGGLLRLSELGTGEEAEIVRLDGTLQGLTRRRLLDLGLTSRARVTAELANAFGDPRAFRVRGTTVALRNEQAARIWVRRMEGRA